MTNWNQAQEAMREAAAKVCDDDDEELAYSGQYNNWNARSDALKLAAAAIRARADELTKLAEQEAKP
jgi:hypothetical protein